MAIPKLKKQDVIDALKFIDENGVPEHNTSVKYALVSGAGKKYPPKYVVAVADYLANGTDISTTGFNAVEAKNYLEGQGFTIETKQQEKFELTITAESVESTDERFTMDNLNLGDNYKPLNAYFKRANGDIIKRAYSKGEKRNSNQTMPRIACQVFEKQLAALSVEDKEIFPVCKYNPDSDVIRGIYTSVDEFKKHRNTIEYLTYSYDDGRQFVIYSWNIFSTIIFVQECLKRFGEPGDQFVLVYREKDEKETATAEPTYQINLDQKAKEYRNEFSSMLIKSKNLIFRGAPGTGKTYLAKEIAADIISNGYEDKCDCLTDEQKKQVEFVQFHPSYDYSDFVEGLRPKVNDDGTMGFELQDGIFKKFVARARKNYEDSQKTREDVEKEVTVQESMEEFFSDIEFGVDTFKTINGNEFTITGVDDKHINISIPGNENVYIIGTMNDIDRSVDSFDFAMRRRFRFVELKADEHLEAINESIEDEERRSEAIRRMSELNKAIAEVEDLNENYQIGAAYFAKLRTLDFDQLWTDYLQPLLQEYIQGMYDEEGIMNRFARAYGYQKPARGDENEAAQDQG